MYLDSAIIVKLLVAEPDSPLFVKSTQGAPLGTSELSYTEVSAALFKKQRDSLLSPSERMRAWKKFLDWTDSEEIMLYPLDTHTVRNSHRILDMANPTIALRSMDSIHVSACDLYQDFPLCATDHRMRAAASKLRIPLFPEKLPI